MDQAVQSDKKDENKTGSRPLRIQFVVTSLPVGGAEILLRDLLQNLDPKNFEAEVTCLKDTGEFGDEIARIVPVHSKFLSSKWDVRVLSRLTKHFRSRETDAVITVGAGDKMFWGRLAAYRAGVPVVCSALHSTGWPDGIGFLNKLLTPITTGFIACADNHAHHLMHGEELPEEKVFAIPNGVDTSRFSPDNSQRLSLRAELGIPAASPVIGIVAALREEKNHIQFVRSAGQVVADFPEVHFVIVGDGVERSNIELEIAALGLKDNVHMLGNRNDTHAILAGLDVFCLTSKNEANPVSILEALACGVPVVAPDVGSINESVLHRQTGFLTEPESVESTTAALLKLLSNPPVASSMGVAGRQLVREQFSLQAMVTGYQDLIGKLYNQQAERRGKELWSPVSPSSTDTEPDQISPTTPAVPLPIPASTIFPAVTRST